MSRCCCFGWDSERETTIYKKNIVKIFRVLLYANALFCLWSPSCNFLARWLWLQHEIGVWGLKNEYREDKFCIQTQPTDEQTYVCCLLWETTNSLVCYTRQDNSLNIIHFLKTEYSTCASQWDKSVHNKALTRRMAITLQPLDLIIFPQTHLLTTTNICAWSNMPRNTWK